MSEALGKLKKTYKRCNRLINAYDAESLNNKDLLRSSIVLAVAGMDGYIIDVFSEYFVLFLKTNSIDKSMEEQMEKYGITIAFAVNLLKESSPYEKIHSMMLKYYEHTAMQNLDKIDDLFKLYALPSITSKATKKAKSLNLRDNVKKVVERRNQIVHSGDYKNNRLVDITIEDAEMIREILELVMNIDDIIDNRFHKTNAVAS